MSIKSRDSVVARRQESLYRCYGKDPEQAITTKRVMTTQRQSTDALHGTVVAPDFHDVVWEYGIDAKVGGYDDLPNPGHLPCAALAACVDSTIRMIADRLEVGIDHLEVDVTGDVDVRGCLAIDPSVRPGFRGLRCDVRLRADAAAERRSVETLLAQAERLCVTLDTLRNGVPVTIAPEVAPPAAPGARASS